MVTVQGALVWGYDWFGLAWVCVVYACVILGIRVVPFHSASRLGDFGGGLIILMHYFSSHSRSTSSLVYVVHCYLGAPCSGPVSFNGAFTYHGIVYAAKI